MAGNKDWLHRIRAEQQAMTIACGHLFDSSSPPPFDIQQAKVYEFTNLTTTAENTLDPAKSGERMTLITAQCREGFELLEGKMRFIKSRYLISLTNAKFASLNLNPHKDRPPVPPPHDFIEADISYPGAHTLDLHPSLVAGSPALNPRSGSSYRIYWGVMPLDCATVEATTGKKRELMKPPAVGKELPHSRWMQRRKERFGFDGDSGKTVYFRIRCENSKGKAGEFGSIFSAVIP
jgi:hypothetical protein